MYFKFLWSFDRFKRTLSNKDMLVSSAGWSKTSDLVFMFVWFCCYSTARWGSIILMLISLRALPAGSYVSVGWLASIPHV